VKSPQIEITQDDKTMAMLAHLLGLFTGFLGPLIIYFIKKDSKFVAFHALQEVFFQLALIVLTFITIVLCFLLVGFLLLPFLAIGPLVYIIIACIKAFNGEWFEYVLVGQWARSTAGV
jgi:hypothetical protein